MTNNYDDIIDMPHHVSRNHPQMSLEMRAAQFAPFAALTGHDKAISTTTNNNQEMVEANDWQVLEGYESC